MAARQERAGEAGTESSGRVRSGGATPSARREEGPAASSPRRRWFRFTLPGAWGALVFACLSFTPSLLPRSWLFQGVVTGVTAAIGYGIGVAGAWLWRAFADREARPGRRGQWHAFAVTAVIALTVSVALGQRWQAQIRDLMGVPDPNPALLVGLPVMAAAVFAVLVAASRALRTVYRWTADRLSRWTSERGARALGWAIVAAGVFLVVDGLLVNGLVAGADRIFSVRDTSTPEGAEQPGSALRSGGPGSLVPWDALGRQGRRFTGDGPSPEEIAGFQGGEALEPVRAYAGIAAADTAEERAELAVDDLERAGGFDRAYLMVATTTGTGWVDPGSIDTFEYLAGGDSAAVAMQYSYLPSWISYLVDQDRARQAGRELFDAVYARWSQLPPADRPVLLVFGESLGSFGGETAFSGAFDMRNRTGGVLFAGPPNFNALHREFTDGRDPGSLEVEPVVEGGRTVRYSSDPAAGVEPESAPWEGTRVLYLQHPSDPIVWWSTDLLLRRPDWLREPRGRDVLDEMRWLPVVTFWQVTLDLPLATEVPPGHGHTYTSEYVDGWATLLQPPGWTPERADRLRDLILATAD